MRIDGLNFSTEKDSIVERGVKQQQQVSGQGRRKDIMKVEEAMEPRMKLEGKGLVRRNHWKKEPKCVELEDGGDSRERNKIWSKKENKNHVDVDVDVEEVVKSESKAYIPRENHPVKQEFPRVYISKGDNQNRENAAAARDSMDLRVEEGPVRLNSGQGYYRNQKHYYWSRVPLVWVKKGKNDGAGAGAGGG